MAIVHDLPEAEIGDIPISAQRADPTFQKAKHHAENKAMKKILANLPRELQTKLNDIWMEYNDGKTFEARLVEAADRLATALHATQLVKSGFSADTFITFIDHAELTVKELQIPQINQLIKELRQKINSK